MSFDDFGADDPFRPPPGSVGEDPFLETPRRVAIQQPRADSGRAMALIPAAQVILLLGAVAIVLLAAPRWSLAAWLLAAIAIPLLWAWFFVQDKQRELTGTRRKQQHDRQMQLNEALLALGLIVGFWAAFTFATELAK